MIEQFIWFFSFPGDNGAPTFSNTWEPHTYSIQDVVVVVLFYVGVLEPLGGRPRPEEDMPRRSAGPARQC